MIESLLVWSSFFGRMMSSSPSIFGNGCDATKYLPGSLSIKRRFTKVKKHEGGNYYLKLSEVSFIYDLESVPASPIDFRELSFPSYEPVSSLSTWDCCVLFIDLWLLLFVPYITLFFVSPAASSSRSSTDSCASRSFGAVPWIWPMYWSR